MCTLTFAKMVVAGRHSVAPWQKENMSEFVYPLTRQSELAGLRAVWLSNGRCVLVDIDDPNAHKVIWAACEDASVPSVCVSKALIDRTKLIAELQARLEEGCRPSDLVEMVNRHAQAAADEHGHDLGYALALELAELMLAIGSADA